MRRLPRLIAHLDMDAFYAAVELLRYPELRGRPVVIGGGRRHQPVETVDASGAVTRTFAKLADYAGRGVITTATYEARALGVGSAMGLMKAAQRAPEAVLLPTDFDRYRAYSRRFKDAVRTIAPTIEDRGIDEIYLDLTGVRLPEHDADLDDDPWWRARDVAQALKVAVREATGLTCSIAVAPNKLLAKIASDLDKPDGLTILREADVPLRIWPLPVRRVNGIGPKAAAKLAALGYGTIGELAHADARELRLHFGAHYAAWLLDAAHGRDEREVETEGERKSVSRETTFERDLSPQHDRARLTEIFTWLCERVAADLVRTGYAGRTIGVKLRFDDFRTVTRDVTLDEATQDAPAIRRAAGQCLKRVALKRRIRLLGVRVGALQHA